ncbi:MAG: efflux RND transporter permease subunit [Bacteriovoracaceae bacterium]|nr:efflux RND transporter permease subunit [Bacteriovoracaceae bacterium]
MKNIINYFINRPLIVNLLTVITLLIGVASLFTLQKEIFPKVEFDVVFITTIYPGSSPEDVENLVTIPIERSLKSVDGFKSMNGLSMEGRSMLYIEVDPDYELDQVLSDIKDAVDSIQDLPEDIERPFVKSLTNRHRGTIKIPIIGGTYEHRRTAALGLRDLLEEESKIARVDLDGYRKDEIRVEVDFDKLSKYRLTMSEVANAISARSINLSAGKVELESGDVMIRTIAEFTGIEDIKKVTIRSNTSGQGVLISDIATVVREPTEHLIYQRSQGEEAIFLSVFIKEKADIISTTNQIKDIARGFFKRAKFSNLKYRFTDDASYYVSRRLNVLRRNGLQGMFLVFLCLILFLNFKTAFITSLGAPIAFMTAFFVMNIMGLSFNMISMFGLIMVLGMLVDDAIIVAEQFYQYLEAGMNPKDAAQKAAFHTIKPVIATVLTTMIAFGALFFMGGIMGKFIWSIPAVVIICLSASLFECFFLLPSHLADFCKLKKGQKSSRWYDFVLRAYEVVLKKFLNFPGTTFILFFMILAGSLFIAKNMRFELFPGDDVRIVMIQMKGEIGIPLDVTNQAMKKIEKTVLANLKKEELDQVRSFVGQLFKLHRIKKGSHYASLIIYLTPPDERVRTTDEILNDLTAKVKKLVPQFVVFTQKLVGGPPKGKPVEIELTGENLNELSKLSKEVKKLLDGTKGITSTEIDFEEGKKQLIVDVDDKEARRLGLTTKQIALELRRAYAGDSLTEIRESEDDVEIIIRLSKQYRQDLNILSQLFILNNQGRRIPISKVVKTSRYEGALVIRRQERKRIISVSADLDKEVTTPIKVAKDLKADMDKIIKAAPGFSYKFAGEHKETKEMMGDLMKAAILALVCIFFVLVVIFDSLGQPLVIMLSIPFGLIGVIIIFKLKGMALSFMAVLGVVALIGVVVNDSIVLVTFINERRTQVVDLKEAICKASVTRFRPVILTTFTTVAGLMPLAEFKGGDPFIKPMAISFAWGLLFSTMVTLVFIPSTYLLYTQIVDFFGRMCKKILGSFCPGDRQSNQGSGTVGT